MPQPTRQFPVQRGEAKQTDEADRGDK